MLVGIFDVQACIQDGVEAAIATPTCEGRRKPRAATWASSGCPAGRAVAGRMSSRYVCLVRPPSRASLRC